MNEIHAVVDGTVATERRGKALQVAYAGVVIVDGDTTTCHRLRCPVEHAGVGLGQTSYTAEVWAIVGALRLAPPDRPLIIWSDTRIATGRDKRSHVILREFYEQNRARRTASTTLKLLPIEARDKSLHKIAHQIARNHLWKTFEEHTISNEPQGKTSLPPHAPASGEQQTEEFKVGAKA